MSFKQLTWGVKASFRQYVEAAGGSVSLADGAVQGDDGAFVFAAAPEGDLSISAGAPATGSMSFTGAVTFEAHGGMLNATLTELAVEATEDGLVLTVLDTQMNQGRCAVATLEVADIGADGVVTLKSAITMDGMYQIADNYPPGTELDPVHLT